MSKTKKPAIVVATELAQADIIDQLREQKNGDVQRAMRAVREVTDRGDVNSTRLQGAQVLLKVHGIIDPPGTKTNMKVTTEGDGKTVFQVEVVHIQKPPAEDD